VSEELKMLIADLDSAFFRYAHITGALELYMTVLENPNLQQTFSKVISGSEIDWKEIHRFMVIDGKTIKWYPELPVQTILDQKNVLLGFLYGITLSRLIGDLDFYLGSVLQNHFGHVETSGSPWDRFVQKTKIDLLSRKQGKFIYTILQERHKIEHNKARIDWVFFKRMAKRNIQHAYKEGDPIQKSHIDVLLTHQAIREFAEDVDAAVSKKRIGMQNGG
jgi:hypothetical protein